MARQKHKPQRICIGCRMAKPKRTLIRLVRTPAGKVELDLTGKANGRGAYVCRQASCWEKGLSPERLARALNVVLSSAEVSALQESVRAGLSPV